MAGSRPMTPTQRMQQEMAASQRKRLQRLQVIWPHSSARLGWLVSGEAEGAGWGAPHCFEYIIMPFEWQ